MSVAARSRGLGRFVVSVTRPDRSNSLTVVDRLDRTIRGNVVLCRWLGRAGPCVGWDTPAPYWDAVPRPSDDEAEVP